MSTLSKVGAEGVHCATVPEMGLGVAIKVEDGAIRAQHMALLRVLQVVGALPEDLPPRLAEWERRAVRNTLVDHRKAELRVLVRPEAELHGGGDRRNELSLRIAERVLRRR